MAEAFVRFCCRVAALPYPAYTIVGSCKRSAAGQKD